MSKGNVTKFLFFHLAINILSCNFSGESQFKLELVSIFPQINSVGKKIRTSIAKVWFNFPWNFNYTIKSPLSFRTTCKWLQHAALKLPPGLTCAPDTANPCSEKMTSQPTFLLHVLSKSIINLHRLLICHIITNFDIFSKMKACMSVIYFLAMVCVRKYASNFPTDICTTVGKETQWCAKNETFWV